MTTRRRFIATAALVAAAGPLESANAQAAKQPAKAADFLFVQNAKSMAFDKANGKLVLKDVSPVTVFFSDRPERIAGNMPTSAFVPFWKDGKDSFLKDPPNANLSIFGGGKVTDVVVVLRDPVLTGEDLSYDIKILQGEPPPTAGPVSVFIDIIGMPLTPLSYAGADRRMWRRRYYYR